MRHTSANRWRATVVGIALAVLAAVGEARAQTGTDALIDSLQHRAFNYFWYEANPTNGLIRDRNTLTSPASIAAQGFGLSAICVAVDHGWVSRAQARDRVLTTLQTYWNGPQGPGATGTIGYQGLFYHFLDMTTATRAWECELSTIDTALLLAGILDARQYFDRDDPSEILIRALADSINRRVNWQFMMAASGTPRGLMMGWKPGTAFTGYGQWVGYNEAMIMYLLALGSPTYPVDTTAWKKWTSGYVYGTQYGQTYVIFPPLFGHQYSHCWVDFRWQWDLYMRQRAITYFENSRRATYAQHAYCVANPLNRTGYSDSLWSITAGDGPPPIGYRARGAPPGQNDDGTITPTAAVSSIAFAPELAIPFIRNLYNTYAISVWGDYGFTDGFNLTTGWWDTDVIGIDQGPMVLMIENWRNEKVWLRFMRSPEIQTGLARAGFVPVMVDAPRATGAGSAVMVAGPNPFAATATIRFRLAEAGRVRLGIYDIGGREVARLVDGTRPAGWNEARWNADGIPGGVYYARLESGVRAVVTRLVRLE